MTEAEQKLLERLIDMAVGIGLTVKVVPGSRPRDPLGAMVSGSTVVLPLKRNKECATFGSSLQEVIVIREPKATLRTYQFSAERHADEDQALRDIVETFQRLGDLLGGPSQILVLEAQGAPDFHRAEGYTWLNAAVCCVRHRTGG